MSDDSAHTNSEGTRSVTSPCAKFLEENRNLALFIGRTLDLAKAFDKMMDVLTETMPSMRRELQNIHENPEQRAALSEKSTAMVQQMLEMSELWKQLDDLNDFKPFATSMVTTHSQLLLELLLCRAVDNYLTYITELLALVYRTRPETLKSNETERLDVILQYKSMEDLVIGLAEKRVNELSYLGIQKLSEHLSNKLNLKLFEQTDDLARTVRIVELRNIIVHNRTVVNDRFLSRVSDFPASIGEKVTFKYQEVVSDILYLNQSVESFDVRAVNKFNLPAPAAKDRLW